MPNFATDDEGLSFRQVELRRPWPTKRTIFMKKENQKRPIMVPIQKAAEEFGVSRQTISNWADSGLLQGTTVNGNRFVTRRSLERLKGSYPEAGTDAARIEALRAALEQEEKNLNGTLAAIRLEGRYHKKVDGLVDVFERKVIRLMQKMVPMDMDEEREARMLRSWLYSLPLRKACEDDQDFYRDYIRSIHKYNSLLARLESWPDLQQRIKELQEQNTAMAAETERLRDEVARYRQQSVFVDNEEQWKESYPVLRKSLNDFDLSVRTRTALRVAGIETVGQLVKWTSHQLLGIRNFGRKSLVELRELLESYGLELGMSLDTKTPDTDGKGL